MSDPASVMLKWTLEELSKAVVGILNRAIQVKENRNATSRVSALLSGIPIALAGYESDNPDAHRLLGAFNNNTVPRIGGLIEECYHKRSYMGQYNAKFLYNRLREAEQQLIEFMAALAALRKHRPSHHHHCRSAGNSPSRGADAEQTRQAFVKPVISHDMKIDLPPPSREALDKYPEDQQLDEESESQFKVEAEKNFKLIVAKVRSAGQKVFKYRKYEEIFREVVDIVFLCDATGGMANDGILDQVKDSIAEVIQSSRAIVEKRAGLLRVGLVAYRDVWDEKNHTEIEDLTAEAGRVISHARRLVATGGMDVAEDVVGGLEAAAKLSWWTKHANKKIIVHFAEAPCHGAQYHSLGPKGDFLCDLSKSSSKHRARNPSSVLKDLTKKQVRYVFVKINDSTDLMIRNFKMIMNGDSLTEVPMADPMLCSKILKAIELECPFTIPLDVGSSEFSDQKIKSIGQGQDSRLPSPTTPSNMLKKDTTSMPDGGRTIIATARAQAAPSAPPDDWSEEAPPLPSMGLSRRMLGPARPLPPPPTPPPYDGPKPRNAGQNSYYMPK